MGLSIYSSIYLFVCIYIYLSLYIWIHVQIYLQLQIYLHLCLNLYFYISIYVCVFRDIYITYNYTWLRVNPRFFLYCTEIFCQSLISCMFHFAGRCLSRSGYRCPQHPRRPLCRHACPLRDRQPVEGLRLGPAVGTDRANWWHRWFRGAAAILHATGLRYRLLDGAIASQYFIRSHPSIIL